MKIFTWHHLFSLTVRFHLTENVAGKSSGSLIHPVMNFGKKKKKKKIGAAHAKTKSFNSFLRWWETLAKCQKVALHGVTE